MSRGHGLLQQRIIAYLEQFEHQTAAHISWALNRIYGAPVSMPSLRRALRALESEGAVVNEGTSRNDIWQLSEELLRLANIRKINEEADKKAEAARVRKARKQQRESSKRERINEDIIDDIALLGKEREGDLGRIAKLLEMLGSDHDGEVMAAARKLHSHRLKSGKSWDDLLSPFG